MLARISSRSPSVAVVDRLASQRGAPIYVRFDSLLEARVIIEDWRCDYNAHQPQSRIAA